MKDFKEYINIIFQENDLKIVIGKIVAILFLHRFVQNGISWFLW